MKRIVVLSDMQIPLHNKPAINAVIKFVKDYQPDELFCVGDEADRLVLSGNQVHYVNKAKAVYEAKLAAWEKNYADATTSSEISALLKSKPVWNTVSMYAITPDTYTKFTATGAPDLTAPVAISGVGHESFTYNCILAVNQSTASMANSSMDF